MLYLLWSFIIFIMTLGILITVHEFGHFWIARCCNVQVKRFSIGFGHKLWHFSDKRGTEYVIAAIPLGGYVKMLDEQVDDVMPSCRQLAFNNKTIWQRTAIIISGPIFNFFLAVFAYWIVFLIGIPSYRPVISEVLPNSIAEKAKIFSGMEIKSVNGVNTPDWDSVRLKLINSVGDQEVALHVLMPGNSLIEEKILDLRNWKFEPSKQDSVTALGIIPFRPKIEPILTEVQKDSAAMKAGLQPGDKIIKIDDKVISTWQLFAIKVRDNPGHPLRVCIERKGKEMDIILTPDSKLVVDGKTEGFVGVLPKIVPLPEEHKIFQKYSMFLAIIKAGEKTWQLIRITVDMLGKLVIGDIKLNNLGGPLSIAQEAAASAEHGLVYYLMFLALISINLGIINLFPLPVLDGGHLIFLVIEKLKGEPVSQRIKEISYHFGSILLALLMGLVLFNDFSKLG